MTKRNTVKAKLALTVLGAPQLRETLVHARLNPPHAMLQDSRT